MNINKNTVIAVAVGVAVFGATLYLIKKLPSGNVVTDTLKKGAKIVQG